MNAFNLMAMLCGLRVRDSIQLQGVSAFHLGLFLLGVLYLLAILIMWRGTTARTLLYAAFLAYLGFFVLPTRIHERYLYFALALLTPLALDSWATITMYATLTATFLVNQYVTLRFLDNLSNAAQHDLYAAPIAWINLAALALAIANGCFLISAEELAMAPAVTPILRAARDVSYSIARVRRAHLHIREAFARRVPRRFARASHPTPNVPRSRCPCTCADRPSRLCCRNCAPPLRPIRAAATSSDSSPAAIIDGVSILVSSPVNACVSITSSMSDSTSICLYAAGAMLSLVAMNLVPCRRDRSRALRQPRARRHR